MPESRFSELPLSAQTTYAELGERTRAFEMGNALAGLTGSFHTLKRKGNAYWYFSYREPGAERSPVVYIGTCRPRNATPFTSSSSIAYALSHNEPRRRRICSRQRRWPPISPQRNRVHFSARRGAIYFREDEDGRSVRCRVRTHCSAWLRSWTSLPCGSIEKL